MKQWQGLPIWPAIVAILTSPVSAEVNAKDGDRSDARAVERQTGETSVPQGRGAVDFYHYPESTRKNEKALPLSDEVVQYPVDPVERPRPLIEIGDPFLGNGPIRPGLKIPTGEVLQPWFLLYGSLRTSLQSYHQGDQNTTEWANRLDLIGNLNLSGTERLVFAMRPLDSQNGGYTGYNFEPGTNDGWQEDFNARLTELYFEGELGEIFPGLDPADSQPYDVGFSVGRQQLLIQDGILVNHNIDSVGITRNSLVFDGVSNLRITGLYGWNHINRGNNDVPFVNDNHSANLFGLLSEADTALNNTLNLDVLYVDDQRDASAWYAGLASTQRFGWLNTTFRVNASIPVHNQTESVGSGVLLLAQLSSTLPHSDDIVYFNTFWNINRFTSAARSPNAGSPVANFGILYGPVGIGRYGAPLGQQIDNTIGTAIGYQMFFNGIDSQLIFEAGARTSTRSDRDEGLLGFGLRFEHAIGQHHVLRLDSFVAGQEGKGVAYGLRTEWQYKF
ncbi:MAG: hypothetical protein ACRERU_09005 [Methylococcales bacterium]